MAKRCVKKTRLQAYRNSLNPIVILTPGDLNQILEENDEQEDEEI
jgi:hypothetical protein